MSTDLATLTQDFKELGARLEQALANAAAQPVLPMPAIVDTTGAPIVINSTPTEAAPETQTTPPPDATAAPTVLSVPADTAATLTVAPADSVRHVAEDTVNLAEALVAPALGSATAVSAIEKTVVGDVAIGDTAGAVATLATTAKTLAARSSLLETTAQAHTDQIAALEQRISKLAKLAPSTLRFINLGMLAGAALFFVWVQVAAASGNTWAAHNVQLALVILAIATALTSTTTVA